MWTTILRPARRNGSARLAPTGRAAAVVALAGMLAACHDLLNPPLPAGTQDPKTFNTETGALGRYNDAIGDAQHLFVSYAVVSGRLTDELHVAEVPAADAATLAGLAKHRPRLADCAAVAAVLVGLTELAALVLPVRRVRHGDDSDP